MKVLMLCPLMSSSSMITVNPAATAVSKRHDVKLVGPLLGGRPFIDMNGFNTEYLEPPIAKPMQFAMLSLGGRNRRRLMRGDYDVVHAFKLLPHTAPVAAAAKRKLGKKFVLSIDDYDAAASSNPIKRMVLAKAEKAVKDADAVIVSSTCLQKIYGGEVIYQVPDEEMFLKTKTNPQNVKRKLGIEGKTMVLYAGTFYRHKGIDVLIRAVQSLERDDIALVLAGDGGDEKRLRSISGSETIFTGRLPMKNVAELTAACDIYAIPTLDTEYARAEIPGKIFEPMMLGKPVVASGLSDIPLILGSGKCGMLVKPGDVTELAGAIENLADNPKLATKLGSNAKKRYAANYCMKQYEKKTLDVYRRLGGKP
jgi:glycosyltransferase involved in cell wall biosynthesis